MESTTPAWPIELLGRNVNDKTEKKNGLTYLSWAWAWAEVLRSDPGATWHLHTFGPPENPVPFMRVGETAMVMVTVTMFGQARTCPLPVMDNRNKAIPKPDAMDVNKAIMRCLAKAIGMHGLGLYIYAGEDVPMEDGHDTPTQKPPAPPKVVITATDGAAELLDEDGRYRMDEVALLMVEHHRAGDTHLAADIWFADDTFSSAKEGGNEERVYLWSRLKAESKLRSAINADPRSPRNQDRRAA